MRLLREGDSWRAIVYKYRNKVYFFCCPTCLREFKKARENLEKAMAGEEKE
ncbi:TRASH domain-containing protein [Thermococcus sp. JCM 11816]|uniref:TRASH domain-containing protein n=1 Tax=Thermococcus sp. (strain JCM 11816 / KS-1) TaxID=1295125 RepID=UPI000A4FBC8C